MKKSCRNVEAPFRIAIASTAANAKYRIPPTPCPNSAATHPSIAGGRGWPARMLSNRILSGHGWRRSAAVSPSAPKKARAAQDPVRSEEHTSELQSRENLVCRLLLE